MATPDRGAVTVLLSEFGGQARSPPIGLERIFEEINISLAEQGLFMRKGTIVDATIVAAAPSTKNKARQRNPEMKQTRKGNQWFFGMKAHIGVDAVTGLTHSVVATSANEADATLSGHLVREDQGQHPRQGRAPVSCSQEPLRLSEGSLQGGGQGLGAAVQRFLILYFSINPKV